MDLGSWLMLGSAMLMLFREVGELELVFRDTQYIKYHSCIVEFPWPTALILLTQLESVEHSNEWPKRPFDFDGEHLELLTVLSMQLWITDCGVSRGIYWYHSF